MSENKFTNTLYTNDNLFILNGLNSGLVDLIYLDPPFNTKRIYSAPMGSKAAGSAFKDMWTWQDVNEAYLDTLAVKYLNLTKFIANVGEIHSKAMAAYLTYMAQRIIQMHRVLKDTGSLYLHCDPTASHYLKILLDEIFGKNNFQDEIIWHYDIGNAPKNNYKKKHDTIFRYSKSKETIFHLPTIEPLNQKRYNMIEPETNRKYFTRGDTGKKCYADIGIPCDDVWTFVREGNFRTLNSQAKERTGYPTQKPLALLKRIILASSNENDIVLDPFCGCATTCVAAQQSGRKWIGIDIEKQAVNILVDRLSDDAGLFKDFINTNLVPQRSDVKYEPQSQSVKERLYKEQESKCNGCGLEFDIKNLTIDHIIPRVKGGGDYYENYQLLCGYCNSVKKDRPMEYLRMKIKTREAMLKDKVVFGE